MRVPCRTSPGGCVCCNSHTQALVLQRCHGVLILQVHVHATRADREDADVAPRLAGGIALHLVPPIALVPPSLAFWAGQTNVSQEVVYVLGGSRRTALGPITGDVVPLVRRARCSCCRCRCRCVHTEVVSGSERGLH